MSETTATTVILLPSIVFLNSMILLCIVLILITVKAALNHNTRTRMLQAVGLGEGAGLRQTDYAYWRDPLMYTYGYEIMTFAVDEAAWAPPDSWNNPAEPASVYDTAVKLGIRLNSKALLDLGCSNESCGAWFFADHRSDKPSDQQDFYFAYCDQTDPNNAVLVIYRSHSLYFV